MINLCHACVLHRRALTAPNQATLDEQCTSLPVDDGFAMEKEEANCYLCCIKPRGRDEKGELTTGFIICQKIDQGFQLIQKRMMTTRGEERGNGAWEGDERNLNQIDERQKDEERKLEMSNRVGIHFSWLIKDYWLDEQPGGEKM